jgi:hypothetical protein
MQTGAVSEGTGLSVDAIRFYENSGSSIVPPPRADIGCLVETISRGFDSVGAFSNWVFFFRKSGNYSC